MSAYERAPVRDIIPLGVLSVVEGALTWVAVRVASALMPVAPSDAAGAPPPPSGGRGTTLAVAVWCSPLLALAIWARW